MQTGTYISGLGHVFIIGWAIIGGYVSNKTQTADVQVSDVSIISEAAFAALMSETPEPVLDLTTLVLPVQDDTSADAPNPDTLPKINDASSPDTPQDAGKVPDVPTQELAQTDAQIDMPTLREPATDTVGATLILPTAPISVRDSSGQQQPDQLDVLSPSEQAAPRVDTQAAPKPPTDAETADETQNATTPDDGATEAVDEAVTTAPDQASTEIVTEAKEQNTNVAPVGSSRPRGRPVKKTAADEIAAALAQAQSEGGSRGQAMPAPAPSGPPLTSGEKEGLRLAVQKCWNVGSLSSEALKVTVTIAVSMSVDGKPQASSIELVSSSDGTNVAALQAYEAARRAIIRCGAKGFDLPVDKYDHWREVEMTFNPEKMRIK